MQGPQSRYLHYSALTHGPSASKVRGHGVAGKADNLRTVDHYTLFRREVKSGWSIGLDAQWKYPLRRRSHLTFR